MNSLPCWRGSMILATVLAGSGAFAASLSRADYLAHHSQIEADYKVDRAACDRLGGKDKEICVKKARGRENVAKAELAYNDSGNDADARKLAIAKADSEYAVARERCDDRKGKDKDLCLKGAEAALAKALADAKLARKISSAG